jgi:hypothetical protein
LGWVGFGPVGNTEKKLGADYEQLLRAVFSCFHGQKIGFIFLKKKSTIRTEKLHKIKVRKLPKTSLKFTYKL